MKAEAMDVKEFVAYAKQLLRRLLQLRKLLVEGKIEEAKTILDEIIEDTQGDTQG